MSALNPLKVRQTKEHNVATLQVEGELDVCSVTSLVNCTESLAAQGCRNFALDLHQVTFVDSHAMSDIVKLHENLRARRGALRIVATSPSVDRVMGLMRLHFMRQRRF